MYSEKMRNVEPTGRTPPCSARPLRMAPIACSRTPKWMFRPPQFPAATSPPFLKTTLVEPARSAEPPIDRKSTRLDSTHTVTSYAVFCLNKEEHDQGTRARPAG